MLWRYLSNLRIPIIDFNPEPWIIIMGYLDFYQKKNFFCLLKISNFFVVNDLAYRTERVVTKAMRVVIVQNKCNLYKEDMYFLKPLNMGIFEWTNFFGVCWLKREVACKQFLKWFKKMLCWLDCYVWTWWWTWGFPSVKPGIIAWCPKPLLHSGVRY